MVQQNQLLGLISLSIVIVSVIFYNIIAKNDIKEKIDLIVIVLSARCNFKQRNTLRSTWFKHSRNASKSTGITIKSFFVVGSSDCSIPNNYREEAYSCNQWEFNDTEDTQTNVYGHHVVNNIEQFSGQAKVVKGFSFKVHQDILLKKIGCLCQCQCGNIILRNVINQEILINKSFSLNKPNANQCLDEAYQDVLPMLLLPKGFIGVLIASNPKPVNCSMKQFNKWNNHTRLIQLLRVYNSFNDYQSERPSNQEILMTTFAIMLADRANFLKLSNEKMKSQKQRDDELSLIQTKLQEEKASHKDIIEVDLIDVYRNLPKKLVTAVDLISSLYDFDFLLKTDDDCFINLIGICQRISKLSRRDYTWIGNFRYNMLVDIYGKWSEVDYPSSVYPAFACGSGYLISSKIAHWISKNKKFLHYYQGEDVCMGIWLASILPTYIHDKRFSCAEDAYRSDQLTHCQLNSASLIELFNQANQQMHQDNLLRDAPYIT